MTSPEPEPETYAWELSSPELEQSDKEQPRLSANGASTLKKLDIQGMFWKFVASGSTTTSQDVLNCLARDGRAHVRRRVAENPNTTASALTQLAMDVDATVRAAVARNPNTPFFLLRKLAQDESVDVRYAIAANASMPDAILLSLFLDPDPYVADRASQTMAA